MSEQQVEEKNAPVLFLDPSVLTDKVQAIDSIQDRFGIPVFSAEINALVKEKELEKAEEERYYRSRIFEEDILKEDMEIKRIADQVFTVHTEEIRKKSMEEKEIQSDISLMGMLYLLFGIAFLQCIFHFMGRGKRKE